MKKIQFKDIRQVNSKRVEFLCVESVDGVDKSYDLFYEFSIDNTPSSNALAVSFSSLLGYKQYDNIYIELDINKDVLNLIKQFNGVSVSCRNIIEDRYIIYGNNIIINFSGGFDSLSVLNLFKKDNAKIVSIDFGGYWARESNFFIKFDPYIIRTNIREQDFFRKLEPISWQFMGIGTVLFAEKLNARYYSFGTILEADYNFNVPVSLNVLPFSSLGLQCIQPTYGLTEVGTTKIACHYYDHLIQDSLNSLSNPGTIKRLRKDILARLFLKDIPINKVSGFKFGQDYVFDFLLFYLIKKLGIHFMSQYIADIPTIIVDISSRFNLEFYEKLNPKALITFPNIDICNFYLQKLFESDIDIYNENDFYELSQIRKVLSIVYNQVDNHVDMYNKKRKTYETENMMIDGYVNSLKDDISSGDTRSEIIQRFQTFLTARVAIKLIGQNAPDLQVLSLSDDQANVSQPGWWQEGGTGYVITSYRGELEIHLKSGTDGELLVLLTGLDIREPNDNTKRIPYWIDYTGLSINGVTVFDNIHPAWHDKRYDHTLNVKAGEEITLRLSWLPHRSDV